MAIFRSRAMQIQDQHSDHLHTRRKIEARVMERLPEFDLVHHPEPTVHEPIRERSLNAPVIRRSLRKRVTFRRWGRK